MRWRFIAAIAVVACGIVAAAAVVWTRAGATDQALVPTTKVERGRVDVTIYALGDVRATQAIQIFTPAMGGPLTIVGLASSGGAVRAGDVVIEFDAAEQEFALEQAEFDLELATQEIAKAEAEATVKVAEDEVALLQARFAVRRAELDASANELVGTLVAKQNLLLLEEARDRLAALEKEVRSHGETSLASTDVLREKRNKAQLAVAVARRNIESLQIRAPFNGFITIKPNTMAFGGIIFSAAALPDFRIGDAASPGNLIAEIVDTSRVEIMAKVPEQDRTNVAPGQTATILVDARPDATLRGTVARVSGVASRQIFDSGLRRFDIAFDITEGHTRVRPGTSAALAIAGPTFEDALHVPRAAIFEVSGKPAVYLRTDRGFEPREITVRARTDSVAVIEGVEASTEVALIDPKAGSKPRTPGPSPAVPQRAAR